MSELKRKYEASMRDVLHILGEYDYQYIKEYVEDLEKNFIQLEQSYDKLWDSVNHNPPLKFEELKVGMWVWDNYMKEWIKIKRLKTVIISMNNYQYYIYVENNWGIPVEYEENRFYRKQVEE